MIYLASPYTHPDADERHRRYVAARHAVAYLLNERRWVYSPIVHCHDLALAEKLPTDWVFWKDYNFYMLSRCTQLAILRIDGWEQSKGVAAELTEATRIGLPYIYL